MGADPQIEFWMTIGILLVIGAVFVAMFWLWPTGGDPGKGGDPTAGGGF